MKEQSYDPFIDARFEAVYRQHPLVLVDAGARGGLKSNWAAARRHLHVLGFEPDKREHARLSAAPAGSAPRTTLFDVALHNRSGRVTLHVARDRGLTSLFQPDRSFLDTFPDADRFDTVAVEDVDADTLDNLLRTRGVNGIDFLKADTQGSELLVLEGAAEALAQSALGVEVEVEFNPIYQGQPLFADVDRFLRPLGFDLFDLRPVYWKRSAGRDVGGPRGQIMWADALYLKNVSSLRRTIDRAEVGERKSKVLKALSIATLYGYFDYALEIIRRVDLVSPAERNLIEARLRAGGGRSTTIGIPGRRQLAAALLRLWRIVRPGDDSWSISSANLGNFR